MTYNSCNNCCREQHRNSLICSGALCITTASIHFQTLIPVIAAGQMFRIRTSADSRNEPHQWVLYLLISDSLVNAQELNYACLHIN